MVQDKYGFKHGLFVSSNGSMAMLWKENVKQDIQTFSMSHIDTWVDGGFGVG